MALAINLWELMVDVWVGIGLQLSLQNAICTIFDRPFCELILILRAQLRACDNRLISEIEFGLSCRIPEGAGREKVSCSSKVS